MGLGTRIIGGLLTTGVAILAAPPSALTQERVGVVTNLEGTATVVRVALAQPRLLHFKDDVYVHDRITTGERSIVRVLLGGKATVTARERSVLTITEVPGTSTIELGAGRISVAVSKGLMKPGELLEIRTPNAISAIRGTVVVAEVFPTQSIRSTISVLRGLIDVTRLDTGHRVGPSVNVGALQSITVTGSSPLSRPNALTADEAQRLTSEFRIIPSHVLPAATARAVQQAMQEAMQDAEVGGPPGGSSDDRSRPNSRSRGNSDDNGHGKGKDKDKGKDNSNGRGKGKENRNGHLSTASTTYSSIGVGVSAETSKKGEKK